jgi:predicted dehydrogenase
MLGVGLIGCGQWGLNYLRVLNELEGAHVVAACDVVPERLLRARQAAPGLRVVAEADQIIGDPEIEAVVVATQATRHFEAVRAVLAAGKHCLVEKPLTTEPGQARELRDLAAAQDRVLMVGHIFRYNPAINFVQQLLQSGVIGELEYLFFTRTNLGPIRNDVNVVWDLITHDVSILLHFMNQSPTWVSGQGGTFLTDGCEDIGFATLGFSRGVVANIRASWLDPRKVREITIVGTLKAIVFDDNSSTEPVRIYDKGAVREPDYGSFGEFKMVTRNGDVVIPSVPAGEPLRNQCLHFVDCIDNQKRPLSDGDDGVRVVEIVTAINQSMAARGVPVSLIEASSTA